MAKQPVDPGELRAAVLARLSRVVDPETGVDVVRMRLIEDLVVDEGSRVSYTFRPSSPLCPIAVPLALSIHKAVAEVEGVSGQEVQIVGYIRAEELTRLIREAAAGQEKSGGDPPQRRPTPKGGLTSER